jgi:hypothetical protein
MYFVKVFSAISISAFAMCSIALAEKQNLEDQILARQILAKYDKNGKGFLDAAELNKLQQDIATARASEAPKLKKAVTAINPDPTPVKAPTPGSLPSLSASLVYRKDCHPANKALFVRSDPLDNFHYLLDPQAAAAAKGADISYTDDRVAGTQTATINGRVSYLLFGEQCDGVDPAATHISGIGIAPFVSSSGTWNQPVKKTSTSALQFGTDLQLAISTTSFFTDHYFYISPYYQTDYRSMARIDGINFAYEPVASGLFLDAGPVTPYIGFFWQFRGVLDVVNVANSGLTNLTPGGHEWIGAEARPNLALFPLNSAIAWPDWLGGRFSLIGTFEYYWDAETSNEARYYSTVLQYKLGECKKDPKGSTDLPCAIQGSSAISFEYDWGTNKDTLVNQKQYLAKFSYAY